MEDHLRERVVYLTPRLWAESAIERLRIQVTTRWRTSATVIRTDDGLPFLVLELWGDVSIQITADTAKRQRFAVVQWDDAGYSVVREGLTEPEVWQELSDTLGGYYV